MTAFKFNNEIIKTDTKTNIDILLSIFIFSLNNKNIAKTTIASCPKGHILDSYVPYVNECLKY